MRFHVDVFLTLLDIYLVVVFLGPVMCMIYFQITELTYTQLLKTIQEVIWEEESGLWVILNFHRLFSIMNIYFLKNKSIKTNHIFYNTVKL